MLITRTPFRVSFFGGGTDYPQYYERDGGAVLSTAIDKYTYISVRYMPAFFGVKHRIVWSHIEAVSSIAEILHPAVREGLRYLGFDDTRGLEIHHQGDLPARSGIGSSSSFSVGLLRALLALQEKRISADELARLAIDFEHDVLKEAVGAQDQVAAAHGGLNTISFAADGAIDVEPLRLAPERLAELESHLVLLYTGATRLGQELAAKVVANIPTQDRALRRMREMVDEGVAILRDGGSMADFGTLVDEGWGLKKSLAEGVTTPEIDRIHALARSNGAFGAKVMGSGGAGFMLLIVPPERHDSLRAALEPYVWVSVKVEYAGSVVVYDDRDGQRVESGSLA